ncbi:MAG: hypothetical protein KDD11_01360 [Acidobacteria bacterium]|nr:hypothetical protein [Acidobacteriota bacterium]
MPPRRLSVRFESPAAEWPRRLAARLWQPPAPFAGDLELDRFRAHSEFYRRRLQRVGSWESAPALERDELEQVPLAASATKISFATSSGTSGRRVRIANDRVEWRLRLLMLYRPYAVYRRLPSEVRQVILVDIPPEHENRAPDLVRIGDRRYRRWTLSGRAAPWAQWQRLAAIGPHLLTGFPSGMMRLADEFGPQLRRLRLRVLSPAGEHLTRSWRKTLESAFGAPLYDRYGATECGAIAWQCPECDAYHANADELVIEPQGSRGTLVTPLYLTTQPILRYRLEDQVEWQEGSRGCRVALPALCIVAARRDDCLYDGADRRVAPLAFQFERFDFIRRWSIDQRPGGTIRLHLVTARPPSPDEIEGAVAETRAVVPGRPIEVVLGAPAWDGKFKRVRCRYSPDG